MAEVLAYTKRDNISLAQLAMANETVGLRQERGRNQRLPRQDHRRDAGDREDRPRMRRRSTLPGPIKLKTKAGDVYKTRDEGADDRPGAAIGVVSAAALAGSEENARGHLVITAPTGGSAGVMPAVVYSLGHRRREAVRREDPRGTACRRGGRLSLQAQRDARRPPKAAARPRSASPRRWARR